MYGCATNTSIRVVSKSHVRASSGYQVIGLSHLSECTGMTRWDLSSFMAKRILLGQLRPFNSWAQTQHCCLHPSDTSTSPPPSQFFRSCRTYLPRAFPEITSWSWKFCNIKWSHWAMNKTTCSFSGCVEAEQVLWNDVHSAHMLNLCDKWPHLSHSVPCCLLCNPCR